jgi:hypothetical protein
MARGISAIVSIVLLIAIVVLAAVGVYFYVGGLATKQQTTTKPIVISATPIDAANGTIIVSVLDGTFTGQYLNTTDGVVCDFFSVVTLTQGQQGLCQIPPKRGSVTLYTSNVSSVTVQFASSLIPEVSFTNYPSSSSFSQTSESDFNEGSFFNSSTGSDEVTIAGYSDTRVSFNASQSDSAPIIVPDNDGNAHIFWVHTGTDTYGHLYYKRMAANGSNITDTPTEISTSGQHIASVSGVLDPDGGNVTLVFERNTDGLAMDIYFMKIRASTGAITLGPTLIHDVASSISNPKIALDPSGSGYGVAFNCCASSTDFQFLRLNSQGTVVAGPTIFGTTGSLRDVRIAPGNQSNFFYVMYVNASNVNFAILNSSGSPLVTKGGSQLAIGAFAADIKNQSTDLWVTYVNSTGTSRRLFLMKMNSALTNTSNPAVISTYGGPMALQTFPDLYIDSSNIHAMWIDDRQSTGPNGTSTEVIYRRLSSSGSPSEAEVMVTNVTGNQTTVRTNPVLGVSSSGARYLTWVDPRFGDNEIFFTTTSVRETNSTYRSKVVDTGYAPANISRVSWSETVPSGTFLNMYLNVSNASEAPTQVAVTNGGAPSVTGRFFQYVATLNTTVAGSAPQLFDIAITYKPYLFNFTYTVNSDTGLSFVAVRRDCGDGSAIIANSSASGSYFSASILNNRTDCSYTIWGSGLSNRTLSI